MPCADPSKAGPRAPVIDIFSLFLTHGLMALAALLMLGRPELDDEAAGEARRPAWKRGPTQPAQDD